MVSKLYSIGVFGIETFTVEVEADISVGIPAFDIVGLPDTAVKESRGRVKSAAKNCGLRFPVSRVTVNLAPADIKKEGAVYDLPVLMSVLSAAGEIPINLENTVFIGELSLTGELRPVRGLLAMAIHAKNCGFKRFFVPAGNIAEASAVSGIDIIPINNLTELMEVLSGRKDIPPVKPEDYPDTAVETYLDFSDVKGQHAAKSAIETAAAGGHNILLIGPPGSGKSMLAKRIPSILPEMTFEEQIETTKIHSIAGALPSGVRLIRQRPFRAPHHTISPAGLSGGGTVPKPGEISLAHNGVLFLDELPEFSRQTIEILRQPLEDGKVNITRVAGSLSYDSSFMLVAAMNPCPCGYFGHPTKQCTCSPRAVASYLGKISGPMLDRMDLHIEVPPVDFESLSDSAKGESSAVIRERINKARKIQQERFSGTDISCNARMSSKMLNLYCPMTDDAKVLLKAAFEKLDMSARTYDRILKVARTVADIDASEVISVEHILQAIRFRSLDRKYWNR